MSPFNRYSGRHFVQVAPQVAPVLNHRWAEVGASWKSLNVLCQAFVLAQRRQLQPGSQASLFCRKIEIAKGVKSLHRYHRLARRGRAPALRIDNSASRVRDTTLESSFFERRPSRSRLRPRRSHQLETGSMRGAAIWPDPGPELGPAVVRGGQSQTDGLMSKNRYPPSRFRGRQGQFGEPPCPWLVQCVAGR